MKKNRITFLKNLINIPSFFEGYRRGKVIPYSLIMLLYIYVGVKIPRRVHSCDEKVLPFLYIRQMRV
jgi:hypothetical protein